MYYRYKSKKKSGKFFKYLFYFVILAGLIVTGVRYRQYLYFWKYSYNKLSENISNAVSMKDKTRRREELILLEKILDQYKADNSINPEAYFLSGKVKFFLAETYLTGSFSELFVYEGESRNFDIKAKEGYTQVIKEIRKGDALADGSVLRPEYAVYLAMASYYSEFFSNEEIFEIINNIDTKNILDLEYIRFISLMNILKGKTEYGLNFLIENDRMGDGSDGKLFIAVVQRMAKQYTNSIMNFKELLNKTTDNRTLKLINYNLGMIYFNQSLFKESLAHFENCLNIDDRDVKSRIWMGRNYSALGQGNKAKALWNDVLSADRSNEEVKKLLGSM